MAIHTEKCLAGCGTPLINYEEMGPINWAKYKNDPPVEEYKGHRIVECPVCQARNEVTETQVQGIIRIIGILPND